MTYKIAVDAGHGYNTAGKRTPAGEREWTFNDKVVRAFIAEMKNYEGVEVRRYDDPSGKTDVALSKRTGDANKWGANVYLSFHHNANTGRWGDWTGTETYYQAANSASQRLAQAVHNANLQAYGLRNRGLKTANLHITRETKMPAALIEGGFMDSKIDIVKMRDDKVLANAGKLTAQAVASYAGLKRKAAPKPAPAKPKASGTLYKVQIGAFSKKAGADQLAKRAKSAGFDTYVAKEGSLFKVQLGAFSSLDNAKSLEGQVKRKGFDSFIAKY